MSAKTSADVLIGGKIYTLSGYESEDYLQRVANYINSKINEFDEMEQFRRLPGEMKSTLVELNIADDYFKAKEQAEKLDQDVKEKEKELYEAKHELISLRIKAESSEKEATQLSKENRKLLLQKSKLEAALEDALLGKVKGQAAPEKNSSSGNPAGKQNGSNGNSTPTGQRNNSNEHSAGTQNHPNGNPAGQRNNSNEHSAGTQNHPNGNSAEKQHDFGKTENKAE
ncbi:cell division protein ZapA [Petralouisia muris]|uniref:Cell division protein ZapA n=1 Tax=Petralouisia muris TaxID=3032872 RepID=A0AC61RYC6_9FIRM|nr:cell division protein ZapA [Petralouisia muris]TGY96909.1 cell division protein ZapA [Petralouisia muris]